MSKIPKQTVTKEIFNILDIDYEEVDKLLKQNEKIRKSINELSEDRFLLFFLL